MNAARIVNDTTSGAAIRRMEEEEEVGSDVLTSMDASPGVDAVSPQRFPECRDGIDQLSREDGRTQGRPVGAGRNSARRPGSVSS